MTSRSTGISGVSRNRVRIKPVFLLNFLVVAFSLLPAIAKAQDAHPALPATEVAMGATDARPFLQKLEAALGYANIKMVQYSGSGMTTAVGQQFAFDHDWPRFEVSNYARTIDFDITSSREEYTSRKGSYPLRGGGQPLQGTLSQKSFLSGNYAWDQLGEKVVPQMGGHLYGSPEVDYRKLDVLMTPIGFVKAALAPGANPILVALPMNDTDPPGYGFIHGPVKQVAFTALGKYHMVASVNEQNEIVLIYTWIGNPIYGDLELEDRYLDWKDFGGVKYPTVLHIHQGDIRVANPHNSMLINVSDLKVNVGVPAVSVPGIVRNADTAVAKAESTKLADGVWLIGGSDLNSVAIEFKDFVAVIEAPENEVRSLAVLNEVSRLIPNKVIRYVVNTHAHWDHCGGLRTYITQGAILVTGDANKDFYVNVLFKAGPGRTMQQDRFSYFYPFFAAERMPMMELVSGKPDTISDGSRMIEVYGLGGPPIPSPEEISPINIEAVQYLQSLRTYYHVNSNLVVYLPKENILINSDLYTPPTKDNPVPDNNMDSMKSLQRLIQVNNLNVAQHVSIEGKEPGSNDQFEQIVGRQN